MSCARYPAPMSEPETSKHCGGTTPPHEARGGDWRGRREKKEKKRDKEMDQEKEKEKEEEEKEGRMGKKGRKRQGRGKGKEIIVKDNYSLFFIKMLTN